MCTNMDICWTICLCGRRSLYRWYTWTHSYAKHTRLRRPVFKVKPNASLNLSPRVHGLVAGKNKQCSRFHSIDSDTDTFAEWGHIVWNFCQIEVPVTRPFGLLFPLRTCSICTTYQRNNDWNGFIFCGI